MGNLSVIGDRSRIHARRAYTARRYAAPIAMNHVGSVRYMVAAGRAMVALSSVKRGEMEKEKKERSG